MNNKHRGISMKKTMLIVGLFVSLLLQNALAAQATSSKNIRAAIGTDINLGLGYGVNFRFQRYSGGNTFEFGPDIYFANSTDTYDEGLHTYTDKSSLAIFGVRFNTLFDYVPGKTGSFFIVGAGAAAISGEWSTDSATDSSAIDSGDIEGFASLINFGYGNALNKQADFRIEFPILIFSAYNQTIFAPTITASYGVSF